jgi:hypothetical protein
MPLHMNKYCLVIKITIPVLKQNGRKVTVNASLNHV